MHNGWGDGEAYEPGHDTQHRGNPRFRRTSRTAVVAPGAPDVSVDVRSADDRVRVRERASAATAQLYINARHHNARLHLARLLINARLPITGQQHAGAGQHAAARPHPAACQCRATGRRSARDPADVARWSPPAPWQWR